MTTLDMPLTESAGTCFAVQHAADLVGQRWAAAILWAGLHGARRFTEYRRTVGRISDKVLAHRLKDLEAQGLIQREVIPSTPVQILYSVTEDGAELVTLLLPVVKWSSRRREKRALSNLHAAGSPSSPHDHRSNPGG